MLGSQLSEDLQNQVRPNFGGRPRRAHGDANGNATKTSKIRSDLILEVGPIASRSFVMPAREMLLSIQCHHVRGRDSAGERLYAAP